MRLGRSFLVTPRGLLALVGLATGFALFATLLFSGCANGGFTSTSGRQQKTFGVGGVPPDSYFVDLVVMAILKQPESCRNRHEFI
jgi:hypothetical protein